MSIVRKPRKHVTFAWGVWAETDQKAEQEASLAREMIDEYAASWFTFRSLDQPGTEVGASVAPALSGQTAPTIRHAVGEDAFASVAWD
jgi:hypothetical protein